MATRAKTRVEPRYASMADAADYAGVSTKTIARLLAQPDSGVNRYEILREPRVDLNEIDAHMSRNLYRGA